MFQSVRSLVTGTTGAPTLTMLSAETETARPHPCTAPSPPPGPPPPRTAAPLPPSTATQWVSQCCQELFRLFLHYSDYLNSKLRIVLFGNCLVIVWLVIVFGHFSRTKYIWYSVFKAYSILEDIFSIQSNFTIRDNTG